MKYFGFCAVSLLAISLFGCGGSGATMVLTPQYSDPAPIPGVMLSPDIVTPSGRLLCRSSNIPYLWDSITSNPQIVCSAGNPNSWSDAQDTSHVVGSFSNKPCYISAPNGMPNYLSLLNSLTDGTALGTNSSGEIVGYAVSSPNHIPMYWDAAHNPTALAGANANAIAITNSGAIFGESLNASGTNQDIAFWATANSAIQIVPGTSHEFISFVNAATGLVGVLRKNNAGAVLDAAVITPGTLAVHILKGGPSKITGISDDGTIVGYLIVDPADTFHGTPVVWKDMNANPVELRKLLTTPSNWSVNRAVGILPNGTVVVSAFNLSVSTAQSAYYLTPLH